MTWETAEKVTVLSIWVSLTNVNSERMNNMKIWNFSKEDMENTLDEAKIAIVRALVREHLLTPEVADDWCRDNTIILAPKSVFRTISNIWKKEKEAPSGCYILIVKNTNPERG